jgi:hypothetical protein
MTTHNIVLGGYSSENNNLIVTYGFSGRGSLIFDRVIAAMEKKNVSYTLIDYRYIHPGLADHTLFDDLMGRVET